MISLFLAVAIGGAAILPILACVCFFFATVDWPSGSNPRLVAAGLFLLSLWFLIAGV